jgi:hypothetical protein
MNEIRSRVGRRSRTCNTTKRRRREPTITNRAFASLSPLTNREEADRMFNAAEPVRVQSLSAPIAGEEESLLLDGAAVPVLAFV